MKKDSLRNPNYLNKIYNAYKTKTQLKEDSNASVPCATDAQYYHGLKDVFGYLEQPTSAEEKESKTDNKPSGISITGTRIGIEDTDEKGDFEDINYFLFQAKEWSTGSFINDKGCTVVFGVKHEPTKTMKPSKYLPDGVKWDEENKQYLAKCAKCPLEIVVSDINFYDQGTHHCYQCFAKYHVMTQSTFY